MRNPVRTGSPDTLAPSPALGTRVVPTGRSHLAGSRPPNRTHLFPSCQKYQTGSTEISAMIDANLLGRVSMLLLAQQCADPTGKMQRSHASKLLVAEPTMATAVTEVSSCCFGDGTRVNHPGPAEGLRLRPFFQPTPRPRTGQQLRNCCLPPQPTSLLGNREESRFPSFFFLPLFVGDF